MAQDPNPELFQTWYLYEVYASDLDEIFTVSEIDPPIVPSLTILEDLTFTGVGACNTFEGFFNLSSNDLLETEEFYPRLRNVILNYTMNSNLDISI